MRALSFFESLALVPQELEAVVCMDCPAALKHRVRNAVPLGGDVTRGPVSIWLPGLLLID